MGLFKIFSRKTSSPSSLLSLPQEMIFSVEEPLVRSHFQVTGKAVLEISPSLPPMTDVLKEKGAAFTTRVGGVKETTGGNTILSHWESLPFLDASWDAALLRTGGMAFIKSGFSKLIHETSRVIKPGGTLALSAFHPFSLMAQKSASEGESGFEYIFNLLRENEFHLQWVKEVFFDVTAKKFFVSDAEKKVFDRLKKTPFLIFMVFEKNEGVVS